MSQEVRKQKDWRKHSRTRRSYRPIWGKGTKPVEGAVTLLGTYTIEISKDLEICTLHLGNGPVVEQDSHVRGMGHLVTDPLELLVKWNGVQLTALYDPGATMTLIHQDVATTHRWEIDWSSKARLINIDGTTREHPLGQIHGILDIEGYVSREEALIGNIGHHEMVLGRNFTRKHNSQVQWRNNGPDEVRIGDTVTRGIRRTKGHAAESRSAQIAEKHQKEDRTLEQIVPPEFKDYLDVFSEALAAKLPPHKPYNCSIKLLEGKQPPKGGIYRLSPLESEELKRQIDDMTRKG